MNILSFLLVALLEIIPKGDAFVKPLFRRDSIYVADRIEYGFEVDNLHKGTGLSLPDLSALSSDTLTVVRDWKLDTLKFRKRKGIMKIRGSFIIAPFEEGDYSMPHIYVQRITNGKTDTIVFKGATFRVAEFPIDSARVARNELMPIVRYPLTFKELLPYLIGGVLFLALLAAGIIYWRRRIRLQEEEKNREPAHITALRLLDRYRGSKYWAPDKQKAFYSGVTDVLKNYIDARFGVDAPEMTTAELFDALKDSPEITPDLYEGLKDMFERADFVKFAKHLANDDENASVLPLAVRFVTSTYQSTLEEEQEKDVL